MTNQKILVDSLEMLSMFFVSKYIQKKANTDVMGIDDIMPAKVRFLLATSDTVTTIAEVNSILMKVYII
tara:strand:+ start:112 stop:318 length:207 start_codon:yes stop_codon:yes gene_type:complete